MTESEPGMTVEEYYGMTVEEYYGMTHAVMLLFTSH